MTRLDSRGRSPSLAGPALGALFLLASVAGAAPPVVGGLVPDLTLATIDDSARTLSERDGATVLVFFRGAW